MAVWSRNSRRCTDAEPATASGSTCQDGRLCFSPSSTRSSVCSSRPSSIGVILTPTSGWSSCRRQPTARRVGRRPALLTALSRRHRQHGYSCQRTSRAEPHAQLTRTLGEVYPNAYLTLASGIPGGRWRHSRRPFLQGHRGCPQQISLRRLGARSECATVSSVSAAKAGGFLAVTRAHWTDHLTCRGCHR